MSKIRDVILQTLAYLLMSVIVLGVFVIPITVVLGCFKLITMMFGG